MKILVLGAYGFLGENLSKYLEIYGHKVYRQGRRSTAQIQLNLNHIAELKSLIFNLNPDIIINLIAETNVDYCEENYNNAFQVNSLIPANLAEINKYNDFKLIQISTDQVYSGDGPHIESTTSPINFYGLSKYCGEFFLDKHKSIILRTNFFGYSNTNNNKNFTLQFIKSLKCGEKISLFGDVFFNPIYIDTLSILICEKLIFSNLSGVFNLGSHDPLNKHSFYLSIAEALNLDINLIKKINISDLNLLAKRPQDMSMNISKFEDSFEIKLPKLNEEILKFIADYKKRLLYESAF